VGCGYTGRTPWVQAPPLSLQWLRQTRAVAWTVAAVGALSLFTMDVAPFVQAFRTSGSSVYAVDQLAVPTLAFPRLRAPALPKPTHATAPLFKSAAAPPLKAHAATRPGVRHVRVPIVVDRFSLVPAGAAAKKASVGTIGAAAAAQPPPTVVDTIGVVPVGLGSSSAPAATSTAPAADPASAAAAAADPAAAAAGTPDLVPLTKPGLAKQNVRRLSGTSSPPAAPTVVAPADVVGSVTITGTGAVPDSVTVSDGTATVGTAFVAPDGTWSLSATLSVGAHTLSATQTDPGTHLTSAASAGVTLAVHAPPPPPPPAPTISAPPDAASPVAVTGAGVAGDLISVSEGSTEVGRATVGSGGTWSVSTTLAPGTHTLSAMQIDPANGGTSVASADVTLDIVAPSSPPPAPPPGASGPPGANPGTGGTPGSSSAPGPAAGTVVSAVSGGTVTSADGKATLVFAQGALPADIVVTIAVAGTSPSGVTAASPVYELSATDVLTGAVVDSFRIGPQQRANYELRIQWTRRSSKPSRLPAF
jgi:hypothetical protein